MTRKILFLLLWVCLTACQVAPTAIPLPLPTPTPTPFPKDFSKTFKVGEFNLTLECIGQGEPTIILENAYGYISWNTLSLHRFKDLGRTCTYARPGMNGERVTHRAGMRGLPCTYIRILSTREMGS